MCACTFSFSKILSSEEGENRLLPIINASPIPQSVGGSLGAWPQPPPPPLLSSLSSPPLISSTSLLTTPPFPHTHHTTIIKFCYLKNQMTILASDSRMEGWRRLGEGWRRRRNGRRGRLPESSSELKGETVVGGLTFLFLTSYPTHHALFVEGGEPGGRGGFTFLILCALAWTL